LRTNALETVCYHTRRDNASSVGICLAGYFDDQPPAEAQLEATAALVAHLCGRLRLYAALGGVIGHSELASVRCPGAQWQKGARWRNQLLDRVGQMQEAARLRRQRAIGHYVLFADGDEPDAVWDAARAYVRRFRPTCGFSVEAARHAEFVTIVGDESAIPPAVEDELRLAGCIVERITAGDATALKALLDQMAENGQRFWTITL
jgi:hypothetical protein